MNRDRKYFLVAPDSPVMEKINKERENFKAFIAALKDFQKEHGATNAYHNQRNLFGLQFEGGPPAGWRRKPVECFCVPNLKTKEGKKLKREIGKVPIGFDHWVFSGSLGEGYTVWGDGFVSWAAFDNYGDHVILSVSIEAAVDPPGCTELKMSEYWRIVEEAKEKAA